MGQDRRPQSGGEAEEAAPAAPDPEDTLRQISTWSLAVLATIAVGFVLYVGREIMLPVVAAFVVGIMLGPAARRLEALRVPRPLAALLLVAGVALLVIFVILSIVPRVSELASGLPGVVASLKEKLHVFDGLLGAWRGVASAVAEAPSGDAVALPAPGISWAPWTISVLLPPITGFLFFLVVLLLFIGAWPDLRRAMVMTFASRDSRLTVLKILNEIESGLANYLLIVTLINVCVGALTGHHLRPDPHPECGWIRGSGGGAQFHPDHRPDGDLRGSPPGRSRHRPDHRPGPASPRGRSPC